MRLGVCSLVEDRNTAQFTTVPLGLVLVKLGVDGLKERAHKRDLVGRTDN